MRILHSPIDVYFTENACRDLVRYLKGQLPSINSSKNLAFMMNAIYNFAERHFPIMLYHGWMYRGISLSHPLNISEFKEMDWASWSTDENIAINFAQKNEGKYKYIICRNNKAVNPAAIKDICKFSFENYIDTGFETYNPSREREVIAPMYLNECKILDITNL